MTHNYTTNQILRYIYNELPALDHLETEYAIENEPKWQKNYTSLMTAFQALPKIQFFPSHSVVRSILQYSRMAS